MTLDEAELKVLSQWQRSAQRILGGPVVLKRQYTKTHEWGWVLWLWAVNPDACPHVVKHAKYAIDRETGVSYPVGSRGLRPAKELFQRVRANRAEVDQPVVIVGESVESERPV